MMFLYVDRTSFENIGVLVVYNRLMCSPRQERLIMLFSCSNYEMEYVLQCLICSEFEMSWFD